MNDKFLALISKTNVGNKRAANEDFYGYLSTPNGEIFVVCDGMGGHVGGAIASNLGVDSILSFFDQEPFSDVTEALDNSIKFANQKIFDHAIKNPDLKGMGTTCTVLIAREPELFIAHVGDSRIYLHSEKKLHRITKDHSYVQGLVDEGIISDEEMETHPKKNQILKALGISETVSPTVHKEPIHSRKGDKFLLCTDGLNGEINDQKIESIINKKSDINSVGDDLIDAALKAGGGDNITLQIIKVLNSPFEQSVFPDYSPIKTTVIEEVNTDPDLKTTLIDAPTSVPKKSTNNKIFLIVTASLLVVSLCVFLLTKKGYISFNNPKANKINKSVIVVDTASNIINDSTETLIDSIQQIINNSTLDNQGIENIDSLSIYNKKNNSTNTLNTKIDSNEHVPPKAADSNKKTNIETVTLLDSSKSSSSTVKSISNDKTDSTNSSLNN